MLRQLTVLAIGSMLILSLMNVLATAKDITNKIDEKEAQRLAAMALSFHDPSDTSSLEPDSTPKSPFFDFYGIGRENGSYGYFAVNPWTGDVWALWGCRKLSTVALRKAQGEIRRRFSAEEKKLYQELRKRKPICISGD